MKKHLILLAVCAGLGACQSTPHANNMVLPAMATPQDAANVEQWYQAEWFWRQHSIAFLMMLRPDSDGSKVLLATTLTGQELFALKEQQGQFTVLEQRPETKRIPLAYVYRDVAWVHASTAAFNAMTADQNTFVATHHSKYWAQNGKTMWQAQLQDGGAWLVNNPSASYQMRLTPIDNSTEVAP